MKFYSVHFTCDGGSSAGYKWFLSRRAAKEAIADWRANLADPDESATIKEWHIKPTKAGIVQALNLHASHPDNG